MKDKKTKLLNVVEKLEQDREYCEKSKLFEMFFSKRERKSKNMTKHMVHIYNADIIYETRYKRKIRKRTPFILQQKQRCKGSFTV